MGKNKTIKLNVLGDIRDIEFSSNTTVEELMKRISQELCITMDNWQLCLIDNGKEYHL